MGIFCLVLHLNNAGKHVLKYVLFWRGEIFSSVVKGLVNIYETLLKPVFKLFLIGHTFFTRTATT